MGAISSLIEHRLDGRFIYWSLDILLGIKMFALRSRQVVQQASLIQRQFGISAVVANKVADPIQKLFLDKLNEFKTKSA